MTAVHRWGCRCVVAAIWGMLLIVAAPAAADAVDSVVGPVSVKAASHGAPVHAAGHHHSGQPAAEIAHHPAHVYMRRVISAGDLRRKATAASYALLPLVIAAAFVDARAQRRPSVTAAPPDPTQRGPDLSRSPPRVSTFHRARAVVLTRRPSLGGTEPGGTTCLVMHATSMTPSPAPSTG